MSAFPYRVGLIGFGRIAESAHVPAWRGLDGVELVAIADQCPERRAAAAVAAPAARIFETGTAMLEAMRLDCLDICTPPHDHVVSILAGCDAGVRQIICEKPLAASIADYYSIVDRQSHSRSQVYTINTWVQSDLHRLVTTAVAEGTIGEVKHVRLRTRRPDCALGVSSWRPRWRTDPTFAGGGIVLDHGWHQLYLMARWIGAAPNGVKADLRTVHALHAPVEDEADIDLTFPNATGRIELSWASSHRVNDGEIVGTHGRINIEDDHIAIQADGQTRKWPYADRLSDSSYHPEWFQALFTQVRADEQHLEGQRNLREAAMLVSTLFAAYGPTEACVRPDAVSDPA